MISLSKKVVIVFSVIYILSSVIIILILSGYMQSQVISHSSDKAQLIIERTVAVHEYVARELRPAVSEKLSELKADKDYFDPRWMSAGYISRNLNKYFSSRNSAGIDYEYKMFSVNARAADSEADEYEKKIIEEFYNNPDLSVKEEVRKIDGKSYFVVYKKNVPLADGCMKCHSEPEKAPAELIKYYGDKNGFHRNVGEISAILSIRIPMQSQIEEAEALTWKISGYLISVFFIIIAIQIFYIRKTVTYPIKNLSIKMEEITQNPEKLGESLPGYRSEEFLKLSGSFNKMSAALKDMNENLKDKVDEKTKELKELNKELEQRVKEETEKSLKTERNMLYQKKFADMGQMTEAVAHQWRQPLSTLSVCMADMIQTFERGELDKEYIEEFESNFKNLSSHMNTTISDFLSYFSKGRAEKTFDMAASVYSVVRLIRSQLMKENISLDILFEKDGQEYKADLGTMYKENIPEIFATGFEGDFKQALMNLLQNARDAVNENKGPKKITITLKQKESAVELLVEDSGGGIPENTIQKIFDPYFTTKPEGIGTGIGLQMVKSIVEGGFKGAVSAENGAEGAVFKIVFPDKV